MCNASIYILKVVEAMEDELQDTRYLGDLTHHCDDDFLYGLIHWKHESGANYNWAIQFDGKATDEEFTRLGQFLAYKCVDLVDAQEAGF